MKELSFWQTVVACLKSLMVKMISFKNIGFGVAMWLGCTMSPKLHASFEAWALYTLILVALFFTANEFQRWLIGMLLNKKGVGGEPVIGEQ
jgi:hypothetical protein